MKYPADSPAWLKTIVEELEEDANSSMRTQEPAMAVGFYCAVDKMKKAISDTADSEAERKKRDLHDITFPSN